MMGIAHLTVSATIQDTVFVLADSGGLQTAADISLVVMAVGSALVLFAVALILIQIRKLMKGLNEQIKPAAERARVVAENLEYVSAVIREDVRKVNDSVSTITARLNDASDRVEERVQEFHALMEVVQGEAESVFLDTAAAVRGVRASAKTLGSAPSGEAPPVQDPDAVNAGDSDSPDTRSLDEPLIAEESEAT
jgi:hypothetical protein